MTFEGFTIRGLLSIFLSRAMENMAAEINAKRPGTMQVTDHGWWFSPMSYVPWITDQCVAIHNRGHKIVLVGHSFGATALLQVLYKLKTKNITVDVAVPIDPAAQYSCQVPNNVKRFMSFYQAVPGQLGQGVCSPDSSWKKEDWAARASVERLNLTHLAIANSPYVHVKVLTETSKL